MHIETLHYHANSADYFAHFAHLPYAIFLDSCCMQQEKGRYDIITANPLTVITGDLTQTTIQSKANVVYTNADPFDVTQNQLMQLRKKIKNHNKINLPFTIGALGYMGYDMGKRLEKLPEKAIDDIGIPKAVIGIYHWSIVVDHFTKMTYFISLYPKTHPETQAIFTLLKKEPQQYAEFSISKPFTSNMTKTIYQKAFNHIKKHIIAGDCYQVNLAQRLSGEFTGSPWDAYLQLRKKHPAPFSAFMQLQHGAILSCSPERFIQVHDRHVETKPIKGTMPRFADPTQDKQSAQTLIQSEKDRAENLMIVDLMRNDLSRSCKPGSVRVPKLMALESFSNVHHLVSTITGKLSRDKNCIDLFKHCFPGGSITGAPKIRTMEIIELLEPHRRSVYCGSIFYADIQGNFDSNIAIRTLICDKNKIHCYAGGGIVYDSECDKEYAETWDKVGKIIKILESVTTTLPN